MDEPHNHAWKRDPDVGSAPGFFCLHCLVKWDPTKQRVPASRQSIGRAVPRRYAADNTYGIY